MAALPGSTPDARPNVAADGPVPEIAATAAGAPASADFECAVCLLLFSAPVRTPCGHVFCSGCLQRALTRKKTCVSAVPRGSDRVFRGEAGVAKGAHALPP